MLLGRFARWRGLHQRKAEVVSLFADNAELTHPVFGGEVLDPAAEDLNLLQSNSGLIPW